MSDTLARLIGGGSYTGRPPQIFSGYCTVPTVPRQVQLTGSVVLEGLEYCGPPGTLVVGRVLLLRPSPDAKPVILGNLT